MRFGKSSQRRALLGGKPRRARARPARHDRRRGAARRRAVGGAAPTCCVVERGVEACAERARSEHRREGCCDDRGCPARRDLRPRGRAYIPRRWQLRADRVRSVVRARVRRRRSACVGADRMRRDASDRPLTADRDRRWTATGPRLGARTLQSGTCGRAQPLGQRHPVRAHDERHRGECPPARCRAGQSSEST